MNNSLMEKLMKLDRDKLAEVPTAKVKAERLSKVAGDDVEIILKAISGNLYTSFVSRATNKAGAFDYEKMYEAHAMIMVHGCIEPDLRDKELMKHFGAETPKDLAKKLFPGGELVKMSEKIGELSGFKAKEDSDDGDEHDSIDYDDVKNS